MRVEKFVKLTFGDGDEKQATVAHLGEKNLTIVKPGYKGMKAIVSLTIDEARELNEFLTEYLPKEAAHEKS